MACLLLLLLLLWEGLKLEQPQQELRHHLGYVLLRMTRERMLQRSLRTILMVITILVTVMTMLLCLALASEEEKGVRGRGAG